MQKKTKVFLVIPTLTAGGAQRIISFLAEHLEQNKFTTFLIVIGSKKDMAFKLNLQNLIFLNKKRVLSGIPKLFQLINKEKPDIVLGSIVHLNAVLGFISIFFSKTKFIGRQSSIGSVDNNYNNIKTNRIKSWGIKLALKKLDFVICQSNDMMLDFITMYGIKPSKLYVLHNPITNTQKAILPRNKIYDKDGKLQLITVGRLVKIKGYERILKVLSNLKRPFEYTIIGTGPEQQNILDYAKSLNLQEHIKFIPFTKDVDKYLMESDYYLQGSYAEGFPNSLLESCSVGTPVIAYDVPGGTKEIVENDTNGFLVKNDTEFLKCLQNSKTFEPLTIIDSVRKKFSKEIILKKYEHFFLENSIKN